MNNIVFITDCTDPNAMSRVQSRITSLIPKSFIPVPVGNDLAAAGNLIDQIDAAGSTQALICVNAAPRDTGEHENGCPFGYFQVSKEYGESIVISSIGGYTLSLVKKFGLADTIDVLSPDVFEELGISEKRLTQFRSYELIPKLARALLDGKKLAIEKITMDKIPDPPVRAWYVDNFGNCKLTLCQDEADRITYMRIKSLERYPHLSAVPKKKAGIIVGSSGLGGKRFLEIVVNGGDAAENFRIDTATVLG